MGAPVHRSRPRDRGGDRVPSARTSRPARLATAAGSVAVAAGLGAAAALDAESSAPVLAGAGSAILFLGLGISTRRSGAIPIALLLLGALHVIPDGDPSIGTVIYGSCLLLTAELAYWSIDEHGHRPVEPGVFAPRLLAILAVVAAGDPRERAGARGRRHRHLALAGVDGRRSNRDRGVCRPPRGDGASARSARPEPQDDTHLAGSMVDSGDEGEWGPHCCRRRGVDDARRRRGHRQQRAGAPLRPGGAPAQSRRARARRGDHLGLPGPGRPAAGGLPTGLLRTGYRT